MDTLTKQSYLLEIRSTLYGTVSALFSDPESEKFAMLFTPKIQGCVLDACFQIEELEYSQESTLSKSFQMLMLKLDEKKKENIRNEFVNVFGHTLSKQIAPYALEHLKNSDVFFQTQKLADLNGFYKAFGMEVESIERADHISTQSEFISFLLLKEILALKDELIEEKEVCEKAFFDFSQDHFLDWVKMFAENLVDKVDGEFYSLAGKFLLTFIENEKKSITQILIKD
jgi:TorA maturation chaperone TorD